MVKTKEVLELLEISDQTNQPITYQGPVDYDNLEKIFTIEDAFEATLQLGDTDKFDSVTITQTGGIQYTVFNKGSISYTVNERAL